MKIHNNILSFLKSYSPNPLAVDRLIITSFITLNKVSSIKNKHLKKYIIDKNSGTEYNVLIQFIEVIKKEQEGLSIEDVIHLFEFVISPSNKVVNGAVYTPHNIRTYIVQQVVERLKNKDISKLRFGDLSCGCGGFFISITSLLRKRTGKSCYEIYRDNIFGLDIEEFSIDRTILLLIIYAIAEGEDRLNFKFNLFKGNALSFRWKEECKSIKSNKGFDAIVGNPPYVGSSKINPESKILLKNWSVSNEGKADLYIPFFEIGIENLKSQGVLGLITVNSFFSSLNGRGLRKYFSSNSLDLTAINFKDEQVFRGRNTYTCICFISKKVSNSIRYVATKTKNLRKNIDGDFIKIPYENLDNKRGWLLTENHTAKKIKQIQNIGVQLGDKFKIRNGFATLKNNIFVFKPIKEYKKFWILEKDGKEYKIEKEICRNAVKPNILKNEIDLKKHMEKLIFPYNVDNSANRSNYAKLFEEDYFKKKYPHTYNYLLTQKEILSERDKGNREYEKWYAYGRSQALNLFGLKLLFPYIAPDPRFVLSKDKSLMFYNGYAVLSSVEKDLLVLQKILNSKIFWKYLKIISKPYAGGFISFAKNYIKHFGIPLMSISEEETLLSLEDLSEIDEYLLKIYNLDSSFIE